MVLFMRDGNIILEKRNNRGFSLIELIIAVSIGTIVAGAVALLMSSAIRNYRDQSVNADMQYELQTNLNQMMDEIMASSGVVIVHNSGTAEPRIKYAVFGNFDKEKEVSTGPGVTTTEKWYDAVIFAPGKPYDGKFNIYMNRVEAKTEGHTPDQIAESLYTNLTLPDSTSSYSSNSEQNNETSAHEQYLLGQNASQFNLVLDPLAESGASCLLTGNKYQNPLSVKVELKFEKAATATTIKKHVDDVVYLRNKVTVPIYNDGVMYELKKRE